VQAPAINRALRWLGHRLSLQQTLRLIAEAISGALCFPVISMVIYPLDKLTKNYGKSPFLMGK